MEGEKFGKLKEEKECQFGNIGDLRNSKQRGGILRIILLKFSAFLHENITTFLLCCFQSSNTRQVLSESLSLTDYDRMP